MNRALTRNIYYISVRWLVKDLRAIHLEIFDLIFTITVTFSTKVVV